jgi:DNA-directed RNA polymerase specialized sigma24 family protein
MVDNESQEITEAEIKLAKQGALSAYRSGRGLVDVQDLIGEANLWMVSHMDKVSLWRTQGRHGQNKLRNACRQRCLTMIARERRHRSGLQHGDVFYYTAPIIREVLPDIFDTEDWNNSGVALSSEVRGPSRPAEGNNRIAVISDVRSSFYSLSEKDQNFLMDLYKDGGLPVGAVAATWDVTERTVKRREERIMEKMVERLGGEPPWA